jgi:glycosyltransferase involved in cell wall biosynthesis
MMTKSIKVSMLIHDYYPLIGGAQGQLKKLVPLLSEQGIEVSVITRYVVGCPSYEVIDGIPVYRMPTYRTKVFASLSYTLTSIRYIWKIKPDVIHSYELYSPTTTAMIAKALLNIPVAVKILRGGSLGDIRRLHKKFMGSTRMKIFTRYVDRFIAISDEIQQELSDIGIPMEKHTFIPNGVDTNYFKPVSETEKQQIRHRLNLPYGRLVIFTGRLEAEKRLSNLLTVWDQFDDPTANLIIVGTGGQEEELKNIANDKVHFIGRVDDVLPYLQACDIFILPSESEGLSNAMLEAMAVGLPVIATNVGGASDLITSSDTGWLIDVNDTTGLYRALSEALQYSPNALQQIGLNGRAVIQETYSLRMTADSLCELYRNLS